MKTTVHIPRQKEKAPMKNKNSRRHNRKLSLNLEYKKLRSLLPRATKKRKLQGKVNVVDAAYHYIRQLQTALLDKFSSRGLPPDLASVVGNKVTCDKDVQALALHLIKQSSNCGSVNLNSKTDSCTKLDVNQNIETISNSSDLESLSTQAEISIDSNTSESVKEVQSDDQLDLS